MRPFGLLALSVFFLANSMAVSASERELTSYDLSKIYHVSVREIERNGLAKDYVGCINEGANGDKNIILSLFVIAKATTFINEFTQQTQESVFSSKSKEEVVLSSRERYKDASIGKTKKLIGLLPKANKVCAIYENK
jgi:hypothetical protein